MIHPSYSELMQEVNKETEIDEPPVVNSRYSIVLARLLVASTIEYRRRYSFSPPRQWKEAVVGCH